MKMLDLTKINTRKLIKSKYTWIYIALTPTLLILLLLLGGGFASFTFRPFSPAVFILINLVLLISLLSEIMERDIFTSKNSLFPSQKIWAVIGGYLIPLLIFALVQIVIAIVSVQLLNVILFGTTFGSTFFLTSLFSLPIALFFIGISFLCVNLFSKKMIDRSFALCGFFLSLNALFVSGLGITWISDIFANINGKVSSFLPFSHAIAIIDKTLVGNLSELLPHLIWVLGYTFIVFSISVFLMSKKVSKE